MGGVSPDGADGGLPVEADSVGGKETDVEEINREHPEYRAQGDVWPKYWDLYVGGEQMIRNADRYLVARKNEPGDVFRERLQRAYYENYIGSIIDWYGATLFRREPVLAFEGGDERGRAFYNEFAEDCDLRGSTLSEFFRRQVVNALVLGKSYVVVDFPRIGRMATTRAEEDELGMSRAYLCEYPASSLINWERDEQGELEWAVLRTERVVQGADGEAGVERRWIRYDRETFRIYRQVETGVEKGETGLVDEGRHGLAGQRRVPVFEFSVGEGLWLMNKAASLQLEHFNKSNGLSWALTNGLFAMPVVYTDRKFEQLVGDSYYLQLGQDDKFGWTEPEGHVYEIALRNLDRLKDEIYRVCYLMSQAGGGLSKATAITGYSKERDYAITQEVLRGFGDSVKETMKRVLKAIVAGREDAIGVDVAGLDEFDIGDFSDELADAERLLGMGIESETLRKQVFKKLAMKFLCDARQEVKDQIAREIEGG